MLSQAIDPIHFFVRSYHARMHAYVDRPRRPIFDFMIRAAESPVWRPVCDRHLYEAALNRVHLLLEVSKKKGRPVTESRDCLTAFFRFSSRAGGANLYSMPPPDLRHKKKAGVRFPQTLLERRYPRDKPSTYLLCLR